MKKITIIFISIVASFSVFAQKVDRSIKPKPGPPPEIKLGKTESFTLSNGLKVFVVENHKLPVIACNIEFDIKPVLEGDMAGYQDMMAELLLSGTKSRTKDKLNEEIDQIGARINASANTISGSGLKRYMGKVFELMSDICMYTEMKNDELEMAKEKYISGLETEKNDPDAMVRNVSSVVNFGSNHPYGAVVTEQSIKKISLQNCVDYYRTYFRPNVAYMAIVGDITVGEVKPIIEKYFASWEMKQVPVTEYSIPSLNSNKLTKVAFAPRIGSVQSVVSVTSPIDLKPNSQDLIKARVANSVLGGGSQGRLFLDLREKHAWTYGAYSSIKDDEIGGSFSATVKCRNVVSDSAIGALLDEMKLMQTVKVSDTALQNSISYLSGSYSIGLEDPNKIAQLAIKIERYHLPKDYYQNYLKNLSIVTADDIIEVSKKYIRPEHVNIVVAGSKEEVADKLAKFSADGKIDYYDYSGKSIVPNETKAVTSNITADEVHKKYVEALGGEKAINSIKDLKIVSSTVMQGMPLKIVEIKKAPNMWMQRVEGSMGGKTMVFQKQAYNGTKGYQEAGGQKADLKDSELDMVIESSDLAADLHPEKYGIKRSLKGIETVNGKDAYIIEAVNAKGKKTVEYYDVATSLIIRRISTVEGPTEKTTQVSDYSNYKEVPNTNGYKIPYEVTETEGSQSATAKVESVDVNSGIPDTEFN